MRWRVRGRVGLWPRGLAPRRLVYRGRMYGTRRQAGLLALASAIFLPGFDWPKQGGPVLLGLKSDTSVLLLPAASLVFGRDEGADVLLASGGAKRDKRISRKHLRVAIGSDQVTLTDLGSCNGTRVDGEATTSTELTDGATVAVGGALHLNPIDRSVSGQVVAMMGGSSPRWPEFAPFQRASAPFPLGTRRGSPRRFSMPRMTPAVTSCWRSFVT